MRNQQTVARPVELRGVGLHRGEKTSLRITPAEPDTGLTFVRDDLGGAEVPALQHCRTRMEHATRLTHGKASVDTPEHLLAALFALGVDNARLHLSASEVPILDGSSLPFARALLNAGLEEQDRVRQTIRITRPVVVEDDGRRLEIHPGQSLCVTAAIDFEHEHLGYQEVTIELRSPEDFLLKLAPARTFALKRDVERLQQAGLVRGGSLENAILVDDEGIRGHALRFPDEFVRHKLLDLVGDLALAGCSIQGRVVAWRAGHALHGRLLDALLLATDSFIYEGGAPPAEGPPARPMPPGRINAE